MAIEYTAEQRQQMIEQLRGKRVQDLEWVEDGELVYWVATLDDGSEFSFRFLTELR